MTASQVGRGAGVGAELGLYLVARHACIRHAAERCVAGRLDFQTACEMTTRSESPAHLGRVPGCHAPEQAGWSRRPPPSFGLWSKSTRRAGGSAQLCSAPSLSTLDKAGGMPVGNSKQVLVNQTKGITHYPPGLPDKLGTSAIKINKMNKLLALAILALVCAQASAHLEPSTIIRPE